MAALNELVFLAAIHSAMHTALKSSQLADYFPLKVAKGMQGDLDWNKTLWQSMGLCAKMETLCMYMTPH